MIKPLGDNIVVKIIDDQEQTSGGIYIPDSAKEKPQIAEVIEVGPGINFVEGKEVKMYIKKGDKVIVNKYAGTEIKYEGVEYLIIKQDDVLAIIE